MSQSHGSGKWVVSGNIFKAELKEFVDVYMV